MINCEAQGIILEELPARTGTSKNGNPFEIRQYVIETDNYYHRMMLFELQSFEGPIENPPRRGNHIKIQFVVEARKAQNGNYYNTVKATTFQLLPNT